MARATAATATGFISVKQFARRVSIPRRTAYRWVERGWVRSRRMPSGRLHVYAEEVERVNSGLAGLRQEAAQSGQ